MSKKASSSKKETSSSKTSKKLGGGSSVVPSSPSARFVPKESGFNVQVVAYRKAAGLPVQLAISHEVVDLTSLSEDDVALQWTLATEGYAFPTDGSAIVFTSPGAEKIFSRAKVDRTGRLAVVQMKNIDGLAYAYTVSVVDKSTGLTAVLDPVVQNRLR